MKKMSVSVIILILVSAFSLLSARTLALEKSADDLTEEGTQKTDDSCISENGGEDYVYSEDEAVYFLAFLFNVNARELNRMDAENNTIIRLLTGQLERGSEEEECAKIALLSVAYEAIRENLAEYEQTVNVSRACYVEYLSKKANADIAGSVATSIAQKVFTSICKCILYEICDWEYDVSSIMDYVEEGVDAVKKDPKMYGEKVQSYVAMAVNVASTNKRNMYRYFNEYVNAYISMGQYADTYMEAWDLELSKTLLLYDPILDWRSETNLTTLKRWAKFLSNLELCMKSQYGKRAVLTLNFCYSRPSISFYNEDAGEEYFEQNGFEPEREGYRFCGWYKEPEYVNRVYTPNYGGDTFYARWIENSKLSASGTCGKFSDNVTWYLDKTGCMTISGEGDMLDYKESIRSPWNGYLVKSVVIEFGVTSIGEYAFYLCRDVESVEIPSSVNRIGEYAFFGCNMLRDICIPDGVTSIERCTFDGCTSIVRIDIPDSVTSIGRYAFSKCNIESVEIPKGVTNIGAGAFCYCTRLSKITFSPLLSSIPDYAFYSCDFSFLQIPDNVQTIGERAFMLCDNLQTVVFPNQLTSIGRQAFRGCEQLYSIAIPKSVNEISFGAFSESGLSSVHIEDITAWCNIKRESSAFGYNKIKLFTNEGQITNLVIPMGVTAVSDCAFMNCVGITSATIPDGLKSIGENAFSSCENLQFVSIPDSVVSIGQYAFSYCGFEDIVLPQTVELLGVGAFFGCGKLKTINIPNTLTEIRPNTFAHCLSLAYVELPQCIISIGKSAFANCKSMMSIYIPENVTKIGERAFSDCTNLKSVFAASFDAWNNIHFEDYSANPLWGGGNFYLNGERVEQLRIPDGTTFIGKYAFAGSSSIQSLVLPKSLKEIGKGAFYACKGVQDVYFAGTFEEWDGVCIETENYVVLDARVHYNYTELPFVSSISLTSPEGVPISSIPEETFCISFTATALETVTAVIAVYDKRGALLDIFKQRIKGETVVKRFVTNTEGDVYAVKVMLFSDFVYLKPLCEGQIIEKQCEFYG